MQQRLSLQKHFHTGVCIYQHKEEEAELVKKSLTIKRIKQYKQNNIIHASERKVSSEGMIKSALTCTVPYT